MRDEVYREGLLNLVSKVRSLRLLNPVGARALAPPAVDRLVRCQSGLACVRSSTSSSKAG